MSPGDVKKLLGGYATGTLTPEEQQALFEAALHDQELFDELAREQSLRDLLRDPATRARLLAGLDAPSAPWYRRWWPPAVTAAALALMAVMVVVIHQLPRAAIRPTRVVTMELPPLRKSAEPPPTLPPPPAMPDMTTAALRPLPRALQFVPVPPPPPRVALSTAAAGGAMAYSRAAVVSAEQAEAQMQPALSCRVLQQTAGGEFVDVTEAGKIPAGASVKLRITPAGSGYLRIFERQQDDTWREILAQQAEGGKPVETQPILMGERGQRQFQASLSTEAPQAAEAKAAPRAAAPPPPARPALAARRDAAVPQASITVTLTIQ